MRAAIYARVSTEEQLTGYSIAAQMDACRKLCVDRGWTIAAEFVEEGESGKSFERRPQWQMFMHAAKAGALDVLVCHKIDRFSRATILDSLQTLQDLKGLGITFTSASEPIDLTTPYGEVMLLLMLWFARQYLTNLSAEVTKGRRGRAESGRSNANRPPFGYKRINGTDMPDEATHRFVLAAFERYSTAMHSDTDMARWLNAQGARTLDGNLFTGDAVREMLINPFYAGWIRYRGVREALTNKRTRRNDTKIIRGLHEPIVSQALFDRVQAVRASIAGRRRGRLVNKTRRIYLLQDIARCAHCGERMKCSCSEGGKRRYSCRSNERMIECGAGGRQVREEDLLPQIDGMIAALQIPDVVITRAAELLKAGEADEHAQTRRAEIVAEMKRLDYLFQKGRKPQDAYEKELARLEAELTLLEPITPARMEAAGEALTNLIDAWQADESEEGRRDILKALLAGIEVDALTGRIVKWRPHAEFEALFRVVT